jgi:hypothetical protein
VTAALVTAAKVFRFCSLFELPESVDCAVSLRPKKFLPIEPVLLLTDPFPDAGMGEFVKLVSLLLLSTEDVVPRRGGTVGVCSVDCSASDTSLDDKSCSDCLAEAVFVGVPSGVV